jgi:hypothetical protein
VKPLTPITGEVSGVLNRYAYYKNLRYDSVMLSLSASPFVRVIRVERTRIDGDRLVRLPFGSSIT